MKTYRKEILYPIFLKVSQLSKDTFWVYLYEDLAYGICPFGTYIDQDVIYCRFKGKQFNFNFQNKSCEKIHNDLTHILKTKMRIWGRIIGGNNMRLTNRDFIYESNDFDMMCKFLLRENKIKQDSQL